MEGKIAVLIVALAFFLALFSATLKIHVARADDVIYIRKNGSVEPSTVSIVSNDNSTYTLTDSIDASIIIERSNVVIDGNGHVVRGSKVTSSNGVYLTAVSNVTIRDMTIRDFDFGIYMDNTSENVVTNVGLVSNQRGIILSASSDSVISDCNITDNARYGILLRQLSTGDNIFGNNVSSWNFGIWSVNSSNNSICNNNVAPNNVCGIILESSANNTISGNNIANNEHGMLLAESDFNVLFDNNIVSNEQYGVALSEALNNTFYHNNFMGNPEQVYLYNSLGNMWDNDYPSGGNFWDDYVGADSNRDGVADFPKAIQAGSQDQDRYPLMGRSSSFTASTSCKLDVISNLTVTDFTCSVGGVVGLVVVNGSAGQAAGFCRVCIPIVLLDVGNLSVQVDGGLTPLTYQNLSLADDGARRYIYFTFSLTASPQPTHTITITPEHQTLHTITMLLITATLLARKLSKYIS